MRSGLFGPAVPQVMVLCVAFCWISGSCETVKNQVWYCKVKVISHALMHTGSKLTRTIVWLWDTNLFYFAIMWLLCFSLGLEGAEVRWWWFCLSIQRECSLFSPFILFIHFWVPYNPHFPLLQLAVFLSLSPTLLSGKCRSFLDVPHGLEKKQGLWRSPEDPLPRNVWK